MMPKLMRWRWIILALITPVLLVVSYFAFLISTVDDQGFKDFCGAVKVIESDYQQFYVGKKNYPAYSMAQLQKMGAFEKVTQDEFLKYYWVHHTPFSSETPDDKIVLRIGYGPFGCIPWLCDFSMTKYEVTHDLDAETRARSEQLQQVTKEKVVHQFVVEHPTYSVVDTNAWSKGTLPQECYAEVRIGYRMPGDSQRHEVSFSFLQKKR